MYNRLRSSICDNPRKSLVSVQRRGEIIASREIMSNKPPGLHPLN
jgi:hypothetical protein